MIERMCKISCAVPASLARPFFAFLQEDGRVHLSFSASHQSDETTDRIVALAARIRTAAEAFKRLGLPAEGERTEGEAKTEDFSRELEDHFEALLPQLERHVTDFEARLSEKLTAYEKTAEEAELLELHLLPLQGATPKDEEGQEVSLWHVPQEVWQITAREIEKQCGEAAKFHALQASAKPAAKRRGFRTGAGRANELPTTKGGEVLAELSTSPEIAATASEILRDAGARPWTPPRQYSIVTESAEAGDAASRRINSDVKDGQKWSVTANDLNSEDARHVRKPTIAASRHLKNEEKDGEKRSVTESVKLMRERLRELQTLKERERADLAEFGRNSEARGGYYFKIIDKKVAQYKALSRCERLGDAVIVRGWLPARAKDDFASRLKDKFSDTVTFYAREPEEDEYSSVPSAITHGKFFSPFEIFLKLVQPPAYASADPTSLIGIFFPFFSGCIIGDAGYGLVMLVLMLLLRRKSKNKLVRDVAFVLENVCVWSLFWGVAFGEFFGDIAHRLWGIHPLWVERSEAVMPVLLFSVAIGFAHVLIGMVIGLVQGLRGKHKKHAVEKLGGILVIVSMLVALLSVRQLLPHPAFPVSMVALILGLVLLAAGGGIGGLIEPMTAFGHILSYVRIGAIGLSSAILAVAASKFVDVLGLSALGIFIALSIHLLNFVLAFAESGLHAARLHYVEFMGNFYEAKGTEYTPFTYKGTVPWMKK